MCVLAVNGMVFLSHVLLSVSDGKRIAREKYHTHVRYAVETVSSRRYS